MKIIYTLSKIKGSPNNKMDYFTINHILDENNPDKALCGFNHAKSFNINAIQEGKLEKVTCKKCLKKFNENITKD